MSLKTKKVLSYLFAMLISLFTIYTISQILIFSWELLFDTDLTPKDFSLIIAAFLGFFTSINVLAKYLRSLPLELPLIVINIPNFLYDKQFENEYFIADKKILKENEKLKSELEQREALAKSYAAEAEQLKQKLIAEAYINDIYIRHHKNASRLVRSLLQLLEENKPYWKWEFCNNVLDECITVLQKDRADKSASIYFINDKNELAMYAYNRLEFWSSRNRTFKYNEGFAGHVWSYGETILINDISNSSFFKGQFTPKHEYGSILGTPIKIGDNVVGVLCIQSEKKDGFTHDDEHSIKFYADMCALAHYCDTILVGRGSNEGFRVQV